MKLSPIFLTLCVLPCLYSKPALELLKKVLNSPDKELRAVAWHYFSPALHAQFMDENAPERFEVFAFDDGSYKPVAAAMDPVAEERKLNLTESQMSLIHYLLMFGDTEEPVEGQTINIGQEQYNILYMDENFDFMAVNDLNYALIHSVDETADNMIVTICSLKNPACIDIVDELVGYLFYYSY